MSKKTLNLLIAIFVGLLFLAVGALTAADVPEPDVVSIENEGYKRDIKGPVELHHKKHAEDYQVACAQCHHDYQDGKNVWKEGDPVKKCIECHDPENKQGDVDKLQNAYHNNCKDCHKEVVTSGKSEDAPFRKCNDCHQKK